MTTIQKNITVLLQQWQAGDKHALDALMATVYDELRVLARSRLAGERKNHTLSPTALINEAYLKLADQQDTDWANRAHFFAIAAKMMRRILTDYAREKNRQKRGSGQAPLSLDESFDLPIHKSDDLVSLDEALQALAALDPKQVAIVELKFYGGFTDQEVARIVDSSRATVQREISAARAWLFAYFQKQARR